MLDRKELEARVCECYQVVKREFDRLLPTPKRQETPVARVSSARHLETREANKHPIS